MIYLCAGMYRSGSTWMYNAVRVTLSHAGVPGLTAGWIAEWERLVDSRNAVIKVHSFDARLASMAGVILVSHRDLRDMAASLHRKCQNKFFAARLSETVRDYMKWAERAAYDLRYERLLTGKLQELKKIASALKLPARILQRLDYAAICKEVDAEKFTPERAGAGSYDARNLLHANHITDGRHGTWLGCLSDEIVADIETRFRSWMLAKGYLTQQSRGWPRQSAVTAASQVAILR